MESKESSTVLPFLIFWVVAMVAWILTLDSDVSRSLSEIEKYVSLHGDTFAFVFAKVIIMYVGFIFLLMASFGIGELGSKISGFDLSSHKKFDFLFPVVFIAGFAVGIVSLSWFSFSALIMPFPKVIPGYQVIFLTLIVDVSQCLLGGFITSGIWVIVKKIDFLRFGAIEPVPTEKNKLIVGTKIENGKESWITLGPKSLVTGLLTTASTGSGKSSACLLPWTKQILTNFEPRPSLVVIDPKDSFARDVLKLAKEIGIE